MNKLNLKRQIINVLSKQQDSVGDKVNLPEWDAEEIDELLSKLSDYVIIHSSENDNLVVKEILALLDTFFEKGDDEVRYLIEIDFVESLVLGTDKKLRKDIVVHLPAALKKLFLDTLERHERAGKDRIVLKRNFFSK